MIGIKARAFFLITAASAGAGLVDSGHAGAAVVLNSNAAVGAATLTISGSTLSLPSQVVAAGSGPAAYAKTVSVPSLSKSVALQGGLTVSATGSTITSTASSKGVIAGAGSATATSSTGSFAVKVNSPIGTALSISSGAVTSTATYSITKAGAVTKTGKATISKLVINAPLLGINNVTYSGTPSTADQVLFQNKAKTLTIFLNAQIKTATGGLTEEAVDLHFAKYALFGQTISGDIAIGMSTAN